MKHPPLKRQLINISRTTLVFTCVFYTIGYGFVALEYLFEYFVNLSPISIMIMVVSMFLSYLFSTVSLSRSRAASYMTFPYGAVSFGIKTLFYLFISIETLTLSTFTFILSTLFVLLNLTVDILMLIRSYKADEQSMRERLLEKNELLDQDTLQAYLQTYKYHNRFLIVWFVILVIGEIEQPIFLGLVYVVFTLVTILLYQQAHQKFILSKEKMIPSLIIAIGIIGVILIIRLTQIALLNHLIIILFLHIIVFYPILKILYIRYDKIARHYDKEALLDGHNT